MISTTIILASIISLLAIGYVVWPLLRARGHSLLVEDESVTELVQRKDIVLRSIKELEFDYRMGKLSEEDYARFDQRLRQQAIGLLRRIERLAPDLAGLEEQLEAAIAQARTVTERVPRTAPVNGAGRGHTQAAGDRRFCTECGASVTAKDKFCGQCGTRLTAATVSDQPANKLAAES